LGVGWTVGGGVGDAVGPSAGRGAGVAVGPDKGPDVDPPAVRGGVMTAGGVAVARTTSPVGVGSIVGLGLTGPGLTVAVGVGVADGDTLAGVGDGAFDGAAADDTGPLADGVLAGEGSLACDAAADGRTAVSPPTEGDGVGPPNAPTASAIDARRRFRIPRATTSRAR
jgi:hypothetical protein